MRTNNDFSVHSAAVVAHASQRGNQSTVIVAHASQRGNQRLVTLGSVTYLRFVGDGHTLTISYTATANNHDSDGRR